MREEQCYIYACRYKVYTGLALDRDIYFFSFFILGGVRVTKKEKTLLGISIVSAGAAGYLLYLYNVDVRSLKEKVKETELLRDVSLEAGVFDAAISNLSRRIDNKRCAMNRYLQGGNIDQVRLDKMKEEIYKLEDTLKYAVDRKDGMIRD